MAVFAGAPCSAAPAQDAPVDQVNQSTDDLVVRGRVLSETGEAIPPTKDVVIIALHWTYHVRVKRVISGKVQGPDIVATRDADAGALYKDRDLIFHFTRKPDGTWDLRKVDRAA